jgi:predicted phage terminase large subunit-like protein
MKVVTGECRRLLISFPPQHGKSLYTSHWFPVWLLGNFPKTRLILTSYEQEVAERWGRQVRDTLIEHQALFGIEVSQKSKSAKRWSTTAGGYMVSVGMGGAITGRSADIAIIDDPVKGAEEVASPTTREKHKEWFATTLSTRVQKGGAIILIMTRWHEDDLAGHVLQLEKQGGPSWERVVLPAVAIDPKEVPDGALEYFGPDPLGRQPGEALCPELHDEANLAEFRLTLGEGQFWALYQQYPFTPRGGVFAGGAIRFWSPDQCPMAPDDEGVWHYKPGARKFEKLVQSWDFTYGSLTGRSRCVGQVWGKIGPDFWLLWQVRQRMTFDEMLLAVGDATERFPDAKGKLIEGKACGPQVIRTMRKKISGIISVTPTKSKIARAESVAHLVRGNNVWVPHPTDSGQPWVKGFLEELAAFPLGATDDQIDTMSQALSHLDTGTFKVHKQKPKGL